MGGWIMKKKKHKKLKWGIVIFLAIVIIGTALSDDTDSNNSTKQDKQAEVTAKPTKKSTKSKTTKLAAKKPVKPTKKPQSNDDILKAAIKKAVKDGLGAGEKCTGIDIKKGNVTIKVDLSGSGPGLTEIPEKDLAIARASSITDAILEFPEDKEDLWNKITINFKGIGKLVRYKKDVVDGPAGKYFNITDIDKSSKPTDNDTVKEYSDQECPDDIIISKKVRDDVTGKWRLARTASGIEVQKYALDYYKKHIKDDEIHFIIDFTNGTTNVVKNLSGMIDVSVLEYVSKEEFSAKSLAGGALLAEYYIDMENGKIQKIQ